MAGNFEQRHLKIAGLAWSEPGAVVTLTPALLSGREFGEQNRGGGSEPRGSIDARGGPT